MAHPHADGRPAPLEPAVRSMTLLVAAVIVHDVAAGRVALLRRGRNARFAPGKWDLPSGKSEPGEPVSGTAVRELREETGLLVEPGSLEVVHVVHGAWGVEAPGGFLTVVFATRAWEGELENREPGKHARVRWADTDDLPADFVPSTGSALRGYLRGGPRLTLRGWR